MSIELTIKEVQQDLYEFRNSRGELVTAWHDGANTSYPEDLTVQRMIGDLVSEVYRKGYQDGEASLYNKGYEDGRLAGRSEAVYIKAPEAETDGALAPAFDVLSKRKLISLLKKHKRVKLMLVPRWGPEDPPLCFDMESGKESRLELSRDAWIPAWFDSGCSDLSPKALADRLFSHKKNYGYSIIGFDVVS